jgi:hypothetical protein
MDKKIMILAAFFILFLGFTFADTDGVWHYAKDIRGGIFGADEQDTTQDFTFINDVNLNSTTYYYGVELNASFVNTNEDNSITSNMIVDGSITSADIAPGTINLDDIDTSEIQTKIVGTCDSGEFMVGVDSLGHPICEEGGSASAPSLEYELGEYLIGAQHTIGLCLAEGGEVFDTGGENYICKFSALTLPKSAYECYDSQYVTASYTKIYSTAINIANVVEEGVKSVKISAGCILLKEGESRFNADGTLNGHVTIYDYTWTTDPRYPYVSYNVGYIDAHCPSGWSQHENYMEQISFTKKALAIQCDSLSDRMGSCSVTGHSFSNQVSTCSLNFGAAEFWFLYKCVNGVTNGGSYTINSYAPKTVVGCK